MGWPFIHILGSFPTKYIKKLPPFNINTFLGLRTERNSSLLRDLQIVNDQHV